MTDNFDNYRRYIELCGGLPDTPHTRREEEPLDVVVRKFVGQTLLKI